MDDHGAASRVRSVLVGLIALALTLAGSEVVPQAVAAGPLDAGGQGAAGEVAIEVLSTRADLVSGGDALVEVVLPAGTDPAAIRLDVDGRDVTGSFAVRPDGRYLGVVDGLDVGRNLLTARLPDGSGAYLPLTNHPIGGPIFAGPQVQPWTCAEGAQDEQCNRDPVFEFFYMSTDGGGLQSYDPDDPPDDVAETTTDEGMTVPFIVRLETGTILRDQFRIAVLFDPEQAWEPTAPQAAWNRKLLLTHGSSCDITFAAGEAPSVFGDTIVGDSPTVALGRGFAVASHALDHAGHNCSNVTEAESLIATKEYLVDHYGGPLRYTIGTGCSGGSLAQQHIANSYPGVYQGILPQCSFTDSWSSTMQYQDYVLTRRYFEDPSLWGPGVAWAPNQIAAINGHPNLTNPVTFTEVIAPTRDPSRDCPGLDAALVYHHETNPEGIRCAIQDYMVNSVGRRPPTAWTDNEQLRGIGHARSPLDNVGIQYGLSGLLDGTILPHQFVDVNVKLGSRDIDYEQQEVRTAADPHAIGLAMRTGAVNVGNNMADVAIIDLRGPDPGAFHDVYRTYAMRERLLREQGHADNQLLWRGSVPLVGDESFAAEGLIAMDAWLTAVEADTRDVPLAQKIVEDRPAEVDHRCTDGQGTDVPAEYCDQVVERYSTPRIEAGMPLSDDILKCRLQPLETFDYGDVTFTEAELEVLAEVFPTGVCDYTRQGVEWTPTVPWLDHSTDVGGVAMGPPPVSVPFGPEGPLQVGRAAGPDRIATSVALSALAFPDGAAAAVLARADGFADALAASALAAEVDGPLLLTASDALPAQVGDELRRLGVTHVHLAGGTTAVSSAVEADVAALGAEVIRVAGPDRYATATALADQLVVLGGPVERAVLALGDAPAGQDAWPDALAAANLAATGRAPVLLTTRDVVPAATMEGLQRLGVTSVRIAGGPSAVSDEVADVLADVGFAVSRVSGADRYETAVALAEEARSRGADPGVVLLASGADFADALAAGPAAARLGGVLLLVDPTDLDRSRATADHLAAVRDRLRTVVVAGGPSAVADGVLRQVEEVLAG